MVEKVAVAQDLSPEMVKAGERLLAEFDRRQVPVSGMLWWYQAEPEIWRLIVVMPEVKSRGPILAYQKVQSILPDMPQDQPTLGLENISVWDAEDSIISLMRKAVRIGGRGAGGVRFSRNSIDGVYIDDAYIYRLD